MTDTETPAIAARIDTLKRDPLAIGLLAGTLLLLGALVLWMVTSFDSFPDLLPLHFDAQGNADRIAERRELYVLPAIACIIALMNGAAGLIARVRYGMVFASYLLWAGALMAQCLIWIAAWNITH